MPIIYVPKCCLHCKWEGLSLIAGTACPVCGWAIHEPTYHACDGTPLQTWAEINDLQVPDTDDFYRE